MDRIYSRNNTITFQIHSNNSKCLKCSNHLIKMLLQVLVIIAKVSPAKNSSMINSNSNLETICLVWVEVIQCRIMNKMSMTLGSKTKMFTRSNRIRTSSNSKINRMIYLICSVEICILCNLLKLFSRLLYLILFIFKK